MNPIIQEKGRLQFITNQWSSLSIPRQVEEACKGGCRWIQFRLKERNEEEWLDILYKTKAICDEYEAVLIINDHVTMALEVDATGVHLGNEDMSPDKARQLLGSNKIIGGTANTFEEVQTLYEKGVDYIGIGPYRSDATKNKTSPVLGPEGYRKIIAKMESAGITVPVIAIGGVKSENTKDLLKIGVDGIAVSSLIAFHNNPRNITEEVLNKLNREIHVFQNNQDGDYSDQ